MDTGSHIPHRVCRYVDDDAESRLNRQETQRAFDAMATPVCIPNGGACAGTMAGAGGR